MTPEQIAEIDGCLSSWRQGDVVMGAAVPFIHFANLAAPVTPEAVQLALQAAHTDMDIVAVEIPGFVVVSQTCDLVRNCQERPYVEICPLVSLPDSLVGHLQRNRLARFAPLPALDNKNLAVDLDRVMTVEKGVLASITEQRKRGVLSEIQAQILTETLGRKRTRAALPNEFTGAVGPLRERILNKYEKNSPEGIFVQSVREIRVRSMPSWTADEIEVEFLFVFDSVSQIPADADRWITALLKFVAIGGKIISIDGRPVGLDQLSAASYLESYRLDLDHLSQGR